MNKKKKSSWKKILYLLCAVCFLVAVVAILISQYQKLQSIRNDYNEAKQTETELAIEEDRLNLLLSYVTSDSFARDYAREHYGYFAQNEIVFHFDK